MRDLINALKRSKAAIEEEINRKEPSATAQSICHDYGCDAMGTGYFTCNSEDGRQYKSSMVILRGRREKPLDGISHYSSKGNYSMAGTDMKLTGGASGRIDIILSGDEPLALVGPDALGVMLEMKDGDMEALQYVAERLGIAEFPSAFREFVRNLKELDEIKPPKAQQ